MPKGSARECYGWIADSPLPLEFIHLLDEKYSHEVTSSGYSENKAGDSL